MKNILVPLDGSPLSERALAYALPIARESHGRLRLVQACVRVNPRLLSNGEAVSAAEATHRLELQDARAAMEHRAATLREEGFILDAVVRSGGAADVILEEPRGGAVDLIVMSNARGGLGRAIYGSVADEVLRGAEVPILLVPAAVAPTPAAGRPGSILIALDGSEVAEAVLGHAFSTAQSTGAELVLLRVVDPPPGLVSYQRYSYVRSERAAARRYLDKLAERLRVSGRGEVTVRVPTGPVVRTVLAAAAKIGAYAIAIGTHGRNGLSRLILGSVASGLVEHATVPLLLVSAAQARRTGRSGKEFATVGEAHASYRSGNATRT